MLASLSGLLSEVELGGLGFRTPVVLFAIPIAAVVLFYLFFLASREVPVPRRRRVFLFVSRLAIAALLISAAAQPYTVESKVTAGDPQVEILVDRSDSMAVYPNVVNDLAENIETEGVPVEVTTIGSGVDSRIGDAIVSNVRENGSMVLVSDGHVTGGRSLAEAGELARSVNAVVHAVNLSASESEKVVSVNGPSKASLGVENTFEIQLHGVNVGESASRVTVSIDGQTVASRNFQSSDSFEVTHTFETTGDHTLTVSVSGGDQYEQNNVYYKTIRVVEKPQVLYVSGGRRPLYDILNQLYRVRHVQEVPSNLDEYYAVVMQDVPANNVGDVGALQEYVIDGNGLVVVGGPNSYENGGYSNSPIADMLPVEIGETSRTSSVVLVIDVSGSTERAMSVQKQLALDVIDQMGDDNRVGVVAFNQNAYQVSGLAPLGERRGTLENRIRRLTSTGATFISAGLKGARDLLGNSGNIILISDGIANDKQKAIATARQLGVSGFNIITVGVGQRTDEEVMRQIAEEGGGMFVRADQTSRLRVLFGGSDRQPTGSGLTIVNSGHFITQGVEFESNPPQTNEVTVRGGSDYLVASRTGPAIAAGRYGLGRVVSITAYGNDGTLDGLLSSPDSLVLTRSVNWAIGDPQRKGSDVVSVSDTRVGEATRVIYRGNSRPSLGGLEFSRSGENEFTAFTVPTSRGFKTIGNARYAANYPREYGSFGVSPSLQNVVSMTSGQIFEPGQAAQIAEAALSKASRERQVRQDWDWLALLLGLLLYLGEVTVRRLQEVYGYTLSQRIRAWAS